ncbi:MAG: hypothetical protein ACI9YB_003331 [Halioglobus sp.]|jgi:hypothetical protein
MGHFKFRGFRTSYHQTARREENQRIDAQINQAAKVKETDKKALDLAKKNISRSREETNRLQNIHAEDKKLKKEAEENLNGYDAKQKALNETIVDATRDAKNGIISGGLVTVGVGLAITGTPSMKVVGVGMVLGEACENDNQRLENTAKGLRGVATITKELNPLAVSTMIATRAVLKKTVSDATAKANETQKLLDSNNQIIATTQRYIDSKQPKNTRASSKSVSSASGGCIKPDKPDSINVDMSFANRPDISRSGGSFNPSRDSSGRDSCWT